VPSGLLSSTFPLAAIGWHVLDRFHIGGSFAISPHGVGIAVGYLAGAFVLLHEGPKRGIPEDRVNSLVFWALIGAIVGARVGYVLSHLSEFHNVVDVLQVYKGGISLIGGIIGAVVAGYPIMRKHRTGFLNTMDAASMPLALGIVIGRVGDLVIGDHLGKPTSWALAFQYHGGNLSGYDCTLLKQCILTGLPGGKQEVISSTAARILGPTGETISQGIGVHQTALYDFLSTMGLVLVLLFLIPRVKRTGILFMVFAIWYAGMRIITDFLREEVRFAGLTGSQWTSVAVVAVCTVTLIVLLTRKREPDPAPFSPD
jgi:phosphatidylglycerol---prolipoprotein diacylglyceryl transferase